MPQANLGMKLQIWRSRFIFEAAGTLLFLFFILAVWQGQTKCSSFFLKSYGMAVILIGFPWFFSGPFGQSHWNLESSLPCVGNCSDLGRRENLSMAERWSSVEEVAAHLGGNHDTIYNGLSARKCPLINRAALEIPGVRG